MTQDRDTSGRFAANPVGRPKEEWKKELHDAIRQRFRGARIVDLLEQGLEIAILQKSTKGIMYIVEFIRDTVDGKPVQVIETSDSNAMELLKQTIREAAYFNPPE